jgi:hypothetical protein
LSSLSDLSGLVLRLCRLVLCRCRRLRLLRSVGRRLH